MRSWISPAFLLAIAASAQQNSSAPTFHAASKLVEVDVVARSKGAPAAGLTKKDFTLLDNGSPQEITLFSVGSAKTYRPASAPALVPLPAGAVSNRIERDGESLARATVLLIDHKNTPRIDQAFAVQRVVKFVETRSGRDRIGIYTLLLCAMARYRSLKSSRTITNFSAGPPIASRRSTRVPALCSPKA